MLWANSFCSAREVLLSLCVPRAPPRAEISLSVMPASTRDKYGTGFSSIHRREAPRPGNGESFAWNESAGTTFRKNAERAARASVLRQACCARRRVGTHRTVLMVGDSQLQAVYEHMCDPSRRRLLHSKATTWPAAAEQCTTTSTLLIFVVAAGKWARHFPSFHTADVVLSRLPASTIVKPTAVASNFASPHLLHVHPVRPWFDADSSTRPRCYPQSTCADYRGLASLGSWITNDVVAYRRSLGRDTRLVIVSPNWICDQKLYPSYRRLLDRPLATRFGACRQWLLARGQWPTRQPADGDADGLCSRFTFSALGASNMSSLMQARVRAAPPTRFLDATALTRERCDATEDARHYPTLVPAQAEALELMML